MIKKCFYVRVDGSLHPYRIATTRKTITKVCNCSLSWPPTPKNKLNRPTLIDSFLVFLKSLLDASALSTMVTAYGDKLERVLSLGIALTPSGFLPRLQGIEAI